MGFRSLFGSSALAYFISFGTLLLAHFITSGAMYGNQTERITAVSAIDAF